MPIKLSALLGLLILTITGPLSAQTQPDSLSIDSQMRLAIADAMLAQANSTVEEVAPSAVSSNKSIKKAMLLSLILPGAGEFYLGNHTAAKIFLGTEVATWATYFGYHEVADWRREDLDAFAHKHAGVEISGRDDEFLQILKRYPRSENQPNLSGSYNEGIRRDARIFYPNDVAAQEQYEQENYLAGEDEFTWDTRDNWDKYKVLLHSHRKAEQRAFYATGVAMFTRLASVIDTIWLGKRMQRAQESSKVKIELEGDPTRDMALLKLKIDY